MDISHNTVDDFIEKKVADEFKPLVNEFRLLVKSRFPELAEDMRGGTENYPGTPTYRLNRIVLVLNPTKNFITFAFTDGKSFEDKYGLLHGVGNKSSNIRLRSLNEFDADAMAYYLQQGIDADIAKG